MPKLGDPTNQALTETIEAVRGLRDESFQNNPASGAGFLAEQFALELRQLKREIISNREKG